MNGRPNCPALDEILGQAFPVLDHGFVRLVDYMGNESSIVQAARVSFGRGTKTPDEDAKLVRYLFRHKHTSPFEMCVAKFHLRLPIFVMRQLIRHRTACLSGDTRLHFDLPGGVRRRGNQLYSLTIKEVYNKFQPTDGKQGNPHFKRDRVQGMLLRSLNEETEQVCHTNIVDVWQSGEKPVWEVTFEGQSIKASEDHLFLTNQGWLKLRDAVCLSTVGPSLVREGVKFSRIGPGKNTGVAPAFNPINPETESWAPVPDWEDYYQVSDQGRVRRIVGGQGVRSVGRCKKATVSNNHAVVSLNRPGFQETRNVHQIEMLAFAGACPSGMEVCHSDGNGLNNLISNLRYDTPASNAADRKRDRAVTYLSRSFVVPNVSYRGKEMTYDVEVSGPWHNFSANGFVVHNSVNEVSGRYTEMSNTFQQTKPTEWRLQSKSNKQGSEGVLDEAVGGPLSKQEEDFLVMAWDVYMTRLKCGVAREQARKDLPLSLYTECYWKMDLHNLLHFLRLRMAPDAQLEIREYANVIGREIVARWCPVTWGEFATSIQEKSQI